MDIGQWLGLTGARLDAGQSCHLGVANAFVPSDKHGDLIEALGAAKLNGSDSAVADVMLEFVQELQVQRLFRKAATPPQEFLS